MACASRAASHHFSTGNADVNLDRPPAPVLDAVHQFVNLDRSPDRSLRVVTMRDRCAEDRHDGIANMLVDCPAVALDDTIDDLKKPAEQLVYFLGIALAAQTRESAEIGEEHCHLAAVTARAVRRATFDMECLPAGSDRTAGHHDNSAATKVAAFLLAHELSVRAEAQGGWP